jgi:hypothetical protein
MGHFVGNLKLSEQDIPGSESWSIKVRRRARTIINTLDTGYMELGEILYTVWDTPVNGDSTREPVFQSWGFQSLADYAEQELGLHRRKAEHLRRIFADLQELTDQGLHPRLKRRIVDLGWSKTRELSRVLTVENAKQWVEMGENLSYPELLAAISQAREAQREAEEGAEEDEVVPANPVGLPEDYKQLKNMRVPLFPGQLQTVESAIERAAQITNSTVRGHNLEMICTDYLATNHFGKSDDPKAALKYIAKIERLTGKRFIVVDPDSLDVEYGIGVLEDMAKEED